MWCITIEDGPDIRQAFYHDKDKALIKMSSLVVEEINNMLDDGEESAFLTKNQYIDMQSILNLLIKLKYGKENYNDYRYEVHINKFEFEDVDFN
jgi:hypothetical protein